MEKPIFIDQNTAYLSDSESIVVLNDAKPEHSSVYDFDFDARFGVQDEHISWWGRGNTRPNKLLEKLSASTIFFPTIEDISQIIMSGGLEFLLHNSPEPLAFRDYPLSQKYFHKATQMNSFMFDFFFNFRLFNLVFVEFILDKKGEKIVSAKVLPTQYCRYGRQDNNGLISEVYYSKNWQYYFAVPYSDRYRLFVKLPLQHRNTKPKYKKYVVAYEKNPLGTLYPRASWEGVLGGWLDVSLEVPKLKKALLDNAIFPKFLIKVMQEYWREVYPDFDEKPELKKSRREKLFTEIQERLTGSDKAGRSIGTTVKYDPVNQRTIDFLQILPIENGKLNDNYFNETGEVANYHIYSSLSMPSALIGNSLSNGLRVGGDVGEHFNLFQQKTSYERSLFEELMNYVLEVNEEEGEYKFKDLAMRTLSQTTPSSRDVNKPMPQKP